MFVNSAATQVDNSDEELEFGAQKQGDDLIREPASPVEDSKQRSENERRERGRWVTASFPPTPSENRNRRVSWGCSDFPDAATVVAQANGLVGEVVLSLLSMARYALKHGGRLVFFLPLRGADARLHRLSPAVLEKLEEKSGGADAEGEGVQLSVVYAAKQLFTSPNICRWLVVLEKEAVRGKEADRVASSEGSQGTAHGRQEVLQE